MIQNWLLAIFSGLMIVGCFFAAIFVDSISAKNRERRSLFAASRRDSVGPSYSASLTRLVSTEADRSSFAAMDRNRTLGQTTATSDENEVMKLIGTNVPNAKNPGGIR